MASVAQKPLLLIQARNLITGLALPALLTDDEGGLIFYNESAGAVLGRRFEDIGYLPREEWGREFGPFDEEGRPSVTDSLPLARALREGHPAQGRFHARLAGDLREVEVSALPMIEGDAYDGSLMVFWPVEASVDF
jgi:PAS domain-containing protein